MSRPRKQPGDLRSYRWFGKDDLRSFGHRSRAKQAGFSLDDLDGKPVIAILNTWSDANPCHTHFRVRAEEVKRGIWQAGGFPMEIPVLTLGETYMKPSTMMYRNLLAMEAEEALRSYPADGVVLMGGCDKTVPALVMGATSANLPALMVPAGPMLRGNWRGQILGSGSDVWKYWTERRAGTLDECSWREMEDGIARSFGTCMTMGTASTMGAAVDALGLMLPGASSIPAADSAHPRMATAAGRRIVEMVWEDLRPRDILTTEAFENAVTAAMALGGSTNAIIHLIAMAGRAGAALDLDRFDQLSRRTPFLANIRPSGKFLMEDFYYAGGLRALLRRLGDLLHTECLTVNGRTLGENIADAVVSNDEVILTREAPLGPEGGLAGTARQPCAWRRGHQAHRRRSPPAPARGSGGRVPRLQRHGGADRRSGTAGHRRLRPRASERGTAGWAGHARVGHAADPQEAAGPGSPGHGSRFGRPDERHQLRRLHTARRSRVVRGGPLALVQDGDVIELDVPARRLSLRVDDGELARRREQRRAPAPQYPRGFGMLYSQHVTQADRGCDFDFLEGTAPIADPEIH